MNCAQCKELLMTNYIYNELDARGIAQVDQHMASCKECAAVYEALKKDLVEPLDSTPPVMPPPYVWHRIKDALAVSGAPRPGVCGLLLEKFARVLQQARPALAFAVIVMVLLGGGLARRAMMFSQVHVRNDVQEVSEYDLYEIDGEEQDVLGESRESETALEAYFL